MNKKVVAVSGGFDPLHVGHLRLLKNAKNLGDYLIVILNDDNFLERKKGFYFMPEDERVEMIEGYPFVDEVYLHHPSNPEDMSVCEALEKIKPTIFANGGDRTNINTPERDLCERLGIKNEYNVGGGKAQSSSDMFQGAQRQLESKLTEHRPWGSFTIFSDGDYYKIKSLIVKPGEKLSLQRHKHRNEHWVVVRGNPTIVKNKERLEGEENDYYYIPVGTIHRIENNSNSVAELIEIQTGSYFGEDDIERFEDIYNRKTK